MKACDHTDEPVVSHTSNQCVVYQCNRFCLNKCRHLRCEQRCRLECDRALCKEKCTRRFECQHYCFGTCGEPCMKCLKCHEADLPNEVRKAIRTENSRTLAFVQLECGHLIKSDVLDAHVEKFEKE
jgi:hypothetical protein